MTDSSTRESRLATDRRGAQSAASGRGRLGWHLVRAAGVSPLALGDFLEKHLDSAGGPPKGDPAVLDLLPARIAHSHNVYPLALEVDRLELGVPPTHGSDVIDVVAEATGLPHRATHTPAAVLRRAVERDYLGGLASPVVEPAAGLPARGRSAACSTPARAPELRTSDLSSEAWLRSVIAEAVAREARTVEYLPGPSDAELLIGERSVRTSGLARVCMPRSAELPGATLRLPDRRPGKDATGAASRSSCADGACTRRSRRVRPRTDRGGDSCPRPTSGCPLSRWRTSARSLRR